MSSFLCNGKDLNLNDSYLRSATTSNASLEGVDLTVPGVDRDEPLLPAVEMKPPSSGEDEPVIRVVNSFKSTFSDTCRKRKLQLIEELLEYKYQK